MIVFTVFLSAFFLNSPVSSDKILLSPVNATYAIMNLTQTIDVYHTCSKNNIITDCFKNPYNFLSPEDFRTKHQSLAMKMDTISNGADYKRIYIFKGNKTLNNTMLVFDNVTTNCQLGNWSIGKSWVVWEPEQCNKPSVYYQGQVKEWILSNDPLVKYITFSYQGRTYQFKLFDKINGSSDIWRTDQEGVVASTTMRTDSNVNNITTLIPKNIDFGFGFEYIPDDSKLSSDIITYMPDISTYIPYILIGTVFILVILNVVEIIIQNKLLKRVNKVKVKEQTSKSTKKELFYEYVDYNSLGLDQRRDVPLKDIVYDTVVNDLYKK